MSAPVAKMSPDQVLIELAKDRNRCVTHPGTASEEEVQLVCYALHLFAKWREARAYPLVIRWLSLSDAASTGLSGDVSTARPVSDREMNGARDLA